MSYMFQNCSSLGDIDGASDWDTSKVTNMSYMFRNCTALSDINGASSWNTTQVNNISYILNGCTNASGSFPILGNPSSYTSAFTNAATATDAEITVVYDCIGTSRIDNIVATKSSNSNVVKGSCANARTSFTTGLTINKALKNVANNSTSMDEEDEDTKIVSFKRASTLPNDFTPTSLNTVSASGSEYPIYIFFDDTDGTMYYYSEAEKIYLHSNSSEMFEELTSLEDISGLSLVDASYTTDTSYMFYDCDSLTDISVLSNWDTSLLIDIEDMFYRCSNASGTIQLLGNPSSYTSAFYGTATKSGTQVTVKYMCDITTNIDAIVATKSSASNVAKASSCTLPDVDITIANEIYGNMANINKEFSYTVVVRDDNDTIVPSLGTTFTLKNDESEVLTIPGGYEISVTQEETAYTTTVNNTNSRTITKTVTDDETITYKNTYNVSVDTGVKTIIPPYIVLLLLSILTLLGISHVSKKLELD